MIIQLVCFFYFYQVLFYNVKISLRELKEVWKGMVVCGGGLACINKRIRIDTVFLLSMTTTD